MYEALLWAAGGIAIAGLLAAYDGSRDVFHPLFFMAPMLAFLYTWMPSQLLSSGALFQYFSDRSARFRSDAECSRHSGLCAGVSGCRDEASGIAYSTLQAVAGQLPPAPDRGTSGGERGTGLLDHIHRQCGRFC